MWVSIFLQQVFLYHHPTTHAHSLMSFDLHTYCHLKVSMRCKQKLATSVKLLINWYFKRLTADEIFYYEMLPL